MHNFWHAGEATAFEVATEPGDATVVSHPKSVEPAAEGNADREEEAVELQPLTCPTDLSPKAVALANDHAWSAGLACAQDPEMAVRLVCRQADQTGAHWYASKQVLLTLGGYGLVSSLLQT